MLGGQRTGRCRIGLLPDIVDLGGLEPRSAFVSRQSTGSRGLGEPERTYSVRRSLATCGVMVILPAAHGTETGGGRRKERYQYMTAQYRVTSQRNRQMNRKRRKVVNL